MEWTPEERALLQENGQLGVKLALVTSQLDSLLVNAAQNNVVTTAASLTTVNPLLKEAIAAIEMLRDYLQLIIVEHRRRLAAGEISNIAPERVAPTSVRPTDPRTN